MTIVIWDANGMDPIRFFVTEEDMQGLDGQYINSASTSYKDSDRLSDIVYDADGREKVEMLTEFPCQAVKDGASVIVCGIIP